MTSSKYGILCILLFFIVLILGYGNYEMWSSPSGMNTKKESGKKGETRADSPAPAATSKETVPQEAFSVIAEKNVFNPDRKEFSTTAAAAMAKPVARPQITLFGVVIDNNFQTASIINPGRPLHKGERETKTLKVGDMVGDYKLAKILPDRIVMEGGEDSFEVLLHDPKAPKKRVEVKTPTQPATITSTSSTVTPAVAQPAPPAGMPQPASSPVIPAPTPRPTPTLPTPRTSGPVPQSVQQPPGSTPAPTTSPAVSDPGLWRGRRPVAPVSPSSPPG